MNTYLGVAIDVHDDGTLDVQLDLGFRVYTTQHLGAVGDFGGLTNEEVARRLRAILLGSEHRPLLVETTAAGPRAAGTPEWHARIFLEGMPLDQIVRTVVMREPAEDAPDGPEAASDAADDGEDVTVGRSPFEG